MPGSSVRNGISCIFMHATCAPSLAYLNFNSKVWSLLTKRGVEVGGGGSQNVYHSC